MSAIRFTILLAATASLVVREKLHPALVQLLVQAAQRVHGEAGWFNRAGEFPSAAVPDLPLAPEAARFYRDGLPWLQRYLPFWLANFVDRMWIVLLPLLAAAVPLSRVLPPLVELRLRSRIFRWYEHLRAVEAKLDGPPADRSVRAPPEEKTSLAAPPRDAASSSLCTPSFMVLERGSITATIRRSGFCARKAASVVVIAVGWCAKSS